ncbi:MAG: NAD-dependent epimerase/dehydratase family protein [Pseudobutyrivibrio sp.]|uniref:saccharopine dehydrogenase NADP-binding domain-containing protein n=1 Tax=Pseudobutyrivibrio sp. TaxID=2014367 RepID=UPI0025EC321D|nr:saccharopine dehydrogenase NADP-binding domain-containing protein [Pseudobutyrivibrio sp.]MBE5903197.1 NAD-dependent epimerase/dehydratase family protein [Pseudobutyrivibrio sp.]
MKIGVLGASGRAGKGALEVLKIKHCDILAGCRNATNVNEVEAVKVDVFNSEQLADFINRCDLIINCAGPASLIGDTVAVSCTRAGKTLIDVAGNDSMVDKVKKSCENRGKILLSAGVYPGLAELFFKMATEMTQLTSLNTEEIFFDYSELSENALLDIKESLDSGEGDSFAYWKNSSVKSIDCHVKEKVVLNNGKTVYLLPMFYKEYQKSCEEINPQKAIFYQGFNEAKDIEKLIQLKNVESENEDSKNKLKDVFCRKDCANGFLILLDCYSNKNDLIRFQIESTFDSAFVSGAVAAMISLTNSEEIKEGVHFASELKDVKSIIKGLKEMELISVKKFRKRN